MSLLSVFPVIFIVTQLLRPVDSGQSEKINPTARIFHEFTKRVRDYAELHKRVEKQLPPLHPNATPEMITAHQKALAAAIRSARSAARQGEIFFPEASREFVKIIRHQLRGPGGRPGRAAIKEDTPPPIFVRVNMDYPESAPLSTVPPTVLLSLPPLPAELEYRFINRDLILRDITANLIVDFIQNALPSL